MKKLTFISGALFTSLTVIGVLFKTLHLQGANVAYGIGMAGIALVFIPAFAFYKYSQSK